MAALLTSEISKPENVVKYIKECREMGIAVEPPDVRISGAGFTPSESGIRFGLTAIKNVGRNAIDSIIAAREQNQGFESVWEFCEKVDLRLMNKRVLESLIKSGALDSFGRRSQLIAVADRAMERAAQAQRDLLAGQHGLFAGLASLFESGNGNGHKSASMTCPTLPTGMKTSACSRKKKCWASLSPAIHWTSMPRSCAT